MLAYCIVCLLALAALFAAAPASASGSIDGTFPDRLITLSKTSPKDNSYTVDIQVPGPGSWWVELLSNNGAWILVQVYDSPEVKGGPVSSTDLKSQGDVSKPTYVPDGASYLARLTYYGKSGSATLQENFIEKPIPDLIDHDPIQIWSDSQFTAENGVVGGTGIETDPYVIQGWMIDAHKTNHAIIVGRTSAYFVIDNVLAYGAGEGYTGVSIYQAKNGLVEDIVAHDCPSGIGVVLCEDVIVRDCLAYSNTYEGVMVADSVRVDVTGNILRDQMLGVWIGAQGVADDTIDANVISNCEVGVYAEFVKTVTISGNSISSCSAAIILGSASECAVSDNAIQSCIGPMGAIYLRYDTNCVVDGNRVELTAQNGICVLDSDAITLTGNSVSQGGCGMILLGFAGSGTDIVVTGNVLRDNVDGLDVFDLGSALIYGNDIVDNTYQAYQGNSVVAWDFMGSGNYWSDYGGSDSNDDGIGDTPYLISGGGVDNYPLMSPLVLP